MKGKIRTYPLIALSWFFCQPSFSALTYDTPYLGGWKPGWSREERPVDVVELLKSADTVWLAQIKEATLISAENSSRKRYHITVETTRVLKGSVSGKRALEWVCWFPDVIPGKSMILFTKQRDAKTVILRAGTAYYRKNRGISLYDVEDLPTDLLCDILKKLLSPEQPEQRKPDQSLVKRLDKLYESGRWGVDRACISLAGALGSHDCIQLLEKDVARQLDNQWDYGRFEVSARLLVRLKKADGVRGVLNSLVTSGARGSAHMDRMKESYVFFVSATETGEAAIEPIVSFVDGHPEYLASAVGALGQIATQRAKGILRSWLLDRNNWERTDTIRFDSFDDGVRLPISVFVVQALVRCHDREAQPLLLKVAEDPEAPDALKKEAAQAAKRLAEGHY